MLDFLNFAFRYLCQIFRGKIWYGMELSTVNEIWVPIIYIPNALNVVKLGSFGGADMVSLWYKHSSVFQYSEILKVKINCEMDFQEFPFDVHNCYWKLRNWLGWIKYVKLNQPRIWYHQNGRAANSAERTEIELKSNKLNFNAYFNSNKSSIINENGYNYSEAAIQITLKRNKIGFLKIISGYYVTTGTFSTMSLLSFFVDPSVVNFF